MTHWQYLKLLRFDHYESVAEELRMNGFDAKVIENLHGPVIECDTIAGTMQYSCSEKTPMGDYYRFINHYGGKLSNWGLKEKIKENNKKF